MMLYRPVYLFSLLCCLYVSGGTFAQQGSYNYFYRNNWQLVNPAAIDRAHYLGRNHPTMLVNAGSRLQWLGLEGAPMLYFASVEYCPEPARSVDPRHKFGVTAFGDRTDAISTYGFYGNYSYFFLLPWGRGHSLHLGISAGYVQYGVDMSRIHAPHIADDIVLQSDQKRSFADFALGAMYRIRRRFFIGLSSPQTFALNLTRDSIHAKTVGLRQVNLTGSWFIARGEPDRSTGYDNDFEFLFEPSFIVRYAPGITYSTIRFLKNSPFSVDVNLRVHYLSKIWYGGGLSTNGNINIEGGYIWKMENGTMMNIGGGYGIPVFQRYQGLGHSVELTFGYYFYN